MVTGPAPIGAPSPVPGMVPGPAPIGAPSPVPGMVTGPAPIFSPATLQGPMVTPGPSQVSRREVKYSSTIQLNPPAAGSVNFTLTDPTGFIVTNWALQSGIRISTSDIGSHIFFVVNGIFVVGIIQSFSQLGNTALPITLIHNQNMITGPFTVEGSTFGISIDATYPAYGYPSPSPDMHTPVTLTTTFCLEPSGAGAMVHDIANANGTTAISNLGLNSSSDIGKTIHILTTTGYKIVGIIDSFLTNSVRIAIKNKINPQIPPAPVFAITAISQIILSSYKDYTIDLFPTPFQPVRRAVIYTNVMNVWQAGSNNLNLSASSGSPFNTLTVISGTSISTSDIGSYIFFRVGVVEVVCKIRSFRTTTGVESLGALILYKSELIPFQTSTPVPVQGSVFGISTDINFPDFEFTFPATQREVVYTLDRRVESRPPGSTGNPNTFISLNRGTSTLTTWSLTSGTRISTSDIGLYIFFTVNGNWIIARIEGTTNLAVLISIVSTSGNIDLMTTAVSQIDNNAFLISTDTNFDFPMWGIPLTWPSAGSKRLISGTTTTWTSSRTAVSGTAFDFGTSVALGITGSDTNSFVYFYENNVLRIGQVTSVGSVAVYVTPADGLAAPPTNPGSTIRLPVAITPTRLTSTIFFDIEFRKLSTTPGPAPRAPPTTVPAPRASPTTVPAPRAPPTTVPAPRVPPASVPRAPPALPPIGVPVAPPRVPPAPFGGPSSLPPGMVPSSQIGGTPSAPPGMVPPAPFGGTPPAPAPPSQIVAPSVPPSAPFSQTMVTKVITFTRSGGRSISVKHIYKSDGTGYRHVSNQDGSYSEKGPFFTYTVQGQKIFITYTGNAIRTVSEVQPAAGSEPV